MPAVPAAPVVTPSASSAQSSKTTPTSLPPKAPSATPSSLGGDMPTIALSQLQNQAGLSVNPSTASGKVAMIQLVSGDEQTNLDQVLGNPITDFASFEQTLKTGMIPKVVAAIVSYAAGQQASDIHIEASESALRVRYRVDGKLRNVVKLPVELHAPLVSRIKILSKLKIDEARLPQDGRFNVQVGGHEIDLRVSTLPTIHGEKVVIRILDKTAGVKQLSALGLNGINLKRIMDGIQEPYGIILVTGPTGSGKSTTLYAMLTEINHPDVNIVTLEDPVEYQVEGINQTQVKPAIGYSFADGLRSILRQDPNVIMVGEIRDSETAALATQAALTGHLVLSTLHTNNAAGAIPRLIDMEVEPFLLASSLDIIIAQRLVRRLCPDCKVALPLPSETLANIKQELELSPVPEIRDVLKKEMAFFGPGSCEKCTDGYQGRIGIYEVITVSESIAQLAIKQATGAEIETLARKEGMLSLRQDGILKALEGLTSIDEVIQATSAE
ncbi:MAG: GspE/PulE family protein [Patescibacteria group bacterium]